MHRLETFSKRCKSDYDIYSPWEADVASTGMNSRLVFL